jgi:hypothetical protein
MADLSIIGRLQLFMDPDAKLNHEYQASSSVASAKSGDARAGIFAPIVDGYVKPSDDVTPILVN